MLLTGTATVVIQYLILLSDTIIAGNMLGETALSAITIVKPIYSIAIFCATLISVGTSVYYSYQIGRFDTKEANRIFSQGVILAVVFGVLLTLMGVLCCDGYLELCEVSDEIEDMARAYFAYYRFAILLVPLYTVLLEIVYADGDQMICNISCCMQILINAICSVGLCRRLGIGGIGIGTLAGILISIALLCIHFFRKCNNLRFEWYVSWHDTRKVFRSGMTDASAYLFMGIMSMVADIYIINTFGEYYLPILLGVLNILELTLVFDGIGQAITPLVNVYRGEQNQTGIRRIMKSALLVAIVEGITTTVVLSIFGSQIAYLLGMRDPELIRQSTLAIRLVSPFFFCTGILFLQTTYYMIIGKEFLATAITGVRDTVVPLAMMIGLGNLGGIYYVWSGLGDAPFNTIILVSLYLCLRYGRKRFPLLFDPPVKQSYLYDAILSAQTIEQLCKEVSEELVRNGYGEADVQQVTSCIRSVADRTYTFNQEGKGQRTLLECSLLLSEQIEVVLRDDGRLMDGTQMDAAPVPGAEYHLADTQYMVTVGYNRNIFRYERG